MAATLLLALSLAAPPDAKPSPLDGVWVIDKIETQGTTIPPGRFGPTDRYTLVVAGGRYAFSTHAGKIAVDAGQRTADLAPTDGRYVGDTLLARYELTGGTLRLALWTPGRGGKAERPAVHAPARGDPHTLYTFQRDDKATPEQAAARLKDQTAQAARQGARGALAPPAGTPPGPMTQELLRQVIDRLDRIEKRLDAIEKAKR